MRDWRLESRTFSSYFLPADGTRVKLPSPTGQLLNVRAALALSKGMRNLQNESSVLLKQYQYTYFRGSVRLAQFQKLIFRR